MTKLLSPDEIKRTAATMGRHAEERTLLDGRHENERRELRTKQRDELMAAADAEEAAAAPLVPAARAGPAAPAPKPAKRR